MKEYYIVDLIKGMVWTRSSNLNWIKTTGKHKVQNQLTGTPERFRLGIFANGDTVKLDSGVRFTVGRNI